MGATRRRKRRRQSGIAMVLAMLFLAMFGSLSLAMLTLSSTNAKVARNHVVVDEARTAAESGLEYLKFWMRQVHISGIITPAQRFSVMTNTLAAEFDARGVTNYTNTASLFTFGSSTNPIQMGEGEFWGQIYPVGVDGVGIQVVGRQGAVERGIAAEFTYGVRQDSVFDFGVATKGPLGLSGNIQLDGVNVAVEADVYIESFNEDKALSIIGNSQIAGDVSITNPDGWVELQGGKASIGGETGQDALDNHVETGVPTTQFPYPDTAYFEQYADGITIDDSTDLSQYTTYDNVRIAAGTNPSFSAGTTFRGVVFIEHPNIVTFSGHASVTGVIVGDGDWQDNSGDSQINFLGSVDSNAASELPNDIEFDGIREEDGTFLIAPGFSVSFGGSFDVLNGAIAGNGVTFFGNAGGVIGGSVINYSDTPMTLSGNSDLLFNRSGIDEIPSGFLSEILMHYQPSSYQEMVL